MVWGLELEPTDIPGLVGAVGFLIFGIWVFLLDPGSPLHRSFGALMALRGGFIFCVRLGETFGSIAFRMAGYFEIAVPFAALYFGFAYRDRIRGTKRPAGLTGPQVFPVIIGLAITTQIAYWRDHRLLTEGPFGALFGLGYLAFGLFAWIFARAATHHQEGPITRKFAFLGAFGLAIEGAYQATWQITESLTEILGGYPGRDVYLIWYIQINQLALLLAAILSVAAAAVVLARGHSLSLRKRWAFALPIFLAALIAIPFAITFALQLIARDVVAVEAWIRVHRVAGGLAMIAGLLVIAYAVLRQRLVNIQWKLNLAVRGTTLAGIFIAVLFALSEGLQVVFQEQAVQVGVSEGVGSAIGIVGAGIVVFALHPVQRFAERLASRTVPNSKPIASMSNPERVALYREQAELAWLDGELRRKERLLLDGLRVRLGLTLAEASNIETKAMNRGVGLGFENRSVAGLPRPPKRARRSP